MNSAPALDLRPTPTHPSLKPYELPCAHCGITVHTFADCDLDDPETEKMVEMIASKCKWLCNACHEEWQMSFNREKRSDRLREWKAIIPTQFVSTRVDKLPNQKAYLEAMKWSYSHKGLALIGATGRGKSRCAWKLMEREFLFGRDVKVIDGMFGVQFGAKYSISAGAAYEWLEQMANAQILLIDDGFKTKMTESAEGAFFNLINHRTQEGKPLIITMQDTGETLQARMTADRGPAMVRRIREFCETITF
jgi:DNA replication protein DnaC